MDQNKVKKSPIPKIKANRDDPKIITSYPKVINSDLKIMT